MSEIITVGLDLAKNVFQVYGADGASNLLMRKTVRRAQVLEFCDLPGDVPLHAAPGNTFAEGVRGRARPQRLHTMHPLTGG